VVLVLRRGFWGKRDGDSGVDRGRKGLSRERVKGNSDERDFAPALCPPHLIKPFFPPANARLRRLLGQHSGDTPFNFMPRTFEGLLELSTQDNFPDTKTFAIIFAETGTEFPLFRGFQPFPPCFPAQTLPDPPDQPPHSATLQNRAPSDKASDKTGHEKPSIRL
jgi:hypothetical protein